MRFASEERPRAARILVVEDDVVQRELLRSALSRQGYEIGTAADGLSAIWEMREGNYDLALIDYGLPEIDGLAAARLIQDLMGTACPRLIALTATPECLAARDLISGGTFTEIIAKSNMATLMSCLERHLDCVPDDATRRASEDALLLKTWTDYDADPRRTKGQRGEPLAPRILVVEDDHLQQHIVRSALETRGYIVETVSDGLQAVRMIRDGIYDLVLVDYRLPELDGLAAARLILNLMSEDVRPPMIALTSSPRHLIDRQEETGRAFDGIIPKSSGLPMLLDAVDRHLRSAPHSMTRRAAEGLRSPLD